MSKIDPKVFFANERTFLKWLHTSVEVGSVASAILGFRAIIPANDEHPGLDMIRVRVTNIFCGVTLIKLQIVGLLLMLVAIAFNAYAIYRFHSRNQLLQLKSGI